MNSPNDNWKLWFRLHSNRCAVFEESIHRHLAPKCRRARSRARRAPSWGQRSGCCRSSGRRLCARFSRHAACSTCPARTNVPWVPNKIRFVPSRLRTSNSSNAFHSSTRVKRRSPNQDRATGAHSFATQAFLNEILPKLYQIRIYSPSQITSCTLLVVIQSSLKTQLQLLTKIFLGEITLTMLIFIPMNHECEPWMSDS